MNDLRVEQETQLVAHAPAGSIAHANLVALYTITRPEIHRVLRIEVTVMPCAVSAANNELMSWLLGISTSSVWSSTRVKLTPDSSGTLPFKPVTSSTNACTSSLESSRRMDVFSMISPWSMIAMLRHSCSASSR